MESIVFIIRKENDSFVTYNILKQSPERVAEIVENFNNKVDSKDKAVIITDPHVVAAILRKDSLDTIKSYCADVKEECDSLRKEIQDMYRGVDRSVERMMEYIEEKIKDAPQEKQAV